jgi:RNA polymerase sigma-70 factor, ECF subfamily
VAQQINPEKSDATAMNDEHSDVMRAKDGDPLVWEAIFRRAYPQLLAYARRRLPTAELAKDAVSEAVARAVANIDRVREDGSGIDAWLYGILRYVVIDIQRTMYREGPGAMPDVTDGRPEPAEYALASEDAVFVRAAFAELSAADQELLELRVVAELSVEEVSRILGRRPGAVRMAQSRALARLRSILDTPRMQRSARETRGRRGA